ncbi:MAG: alanine racemase [Pseudomonadota bacterium]
MARAALTIDLDAICANWRALDALSAAECETAAVLKADAYGCGAARVGPALARAGCRSFFVALAEEGAELRAALGPDPAIYVLSGLLPGDAALIREAALCPVLNSVEQIRAMSADLPGQSCAVQFDTGMNRLGLEPADLAPAIVALEKLRPMLLLSHLACAGPQDHPMNPAQRDTFTAMALALPGLARSLSATGGILLGAPYHFEMTRPGIGLFGGLPFAAANPAVHLSLPVIQTRSLEPGEAVGYGAAWQARRPARVATLSAGYADGLIRALGDAPNTQPVHAFAGEIACPVIGRVSMDLLTVDVTELPEPPDRLDILCTHQGVDALGAAANTIGYEILTSLGSRYARHYKGGEGS